MISNDPLVGTLEEKAIRDPQSLSNGWGSLHSPPKAVRIIYKTMTYTGMITGIILAFPFIAASSAKRWYDKSKKDQDDE